jgi:hypothetical protein
MADALAACLKESDAAARATSAAAYAASVKASVLVLKAGVDSLKAALDNVTDAVARESALAVVAALTEAGQAAEPYIVACLASCLERCSDKIVSVRTAADACVRAISASINVNVTKRVRHSRAALQALALCRRRRALR